MEPEDYESWELAGRDNYREETDVTVIECPHCGEEIDVSDAQTPDS